MPIRPMTTPQLDLSRRPHVGPWMVDMQGFFEFSFWMAEELIDLEVRFRPVVKPVKLRHVAADRARRLERPNHGPLIF